MYLCFAPKALRLLVALMLWPSRCLLNILLWQRYSFFSYRPLFCGKFKPETDKMQGQAKNICYKPELVLNSRWLLNKNNFACYPILDRT